jgi:uncharacterized protein
MLELNRSSRSRLRLVALVCAVVVVPFVVAPAARADYTGSTWTETWMESFDGTPLHVDVFRPKGLSAEVRTPVILSVGPYFNGGSARLYGGPHGGQVALRHPELVTAKIFDRGFTLVQVTLRGYGGSGGCSDLGGPGEQGDVKVAVEWAASQPWSNGRVAMWGKSYDGWTQVMALAMRPRGLAAVVVQAPLLSTYQGLYMNGIHYGPLDWHLTPTEYLLLDLEPNSVRGSSRTHSEATRGAANSVVCGASTLKEAENPDRSSPWWRQRDLLERAAGSDVPVLWAHGFLDANTKPDNMLALWRTLQGPKRAWVGQWAHHRASVAAEVGRDGFLEESMAWIARFTNDDPGAGAARSEDPAVVVERSDGTWRAEDQWPPADGVELDLPIRTGTYLDGPGFDSWSGSPRRGEALWSVSQPFPHEAHISGTARLEVDVKTDRPRVNLIATLFDVDFQGRVRLVTRGGAAVSGGRATFELYPQDWVVRRGRSLAVVITGSDDSWFDPGTTASMVMVRSGRLVVPYLTTDRGRGDLAGKPSDHGAERPRFSLTPTPDERVKAELPPPLRRP